MRANRSFDQIQQNHDRINAYLAELRITRENVNDLIGTGNQVLDDIRRLIDDLESAVPAERPNELIADAKLLMDNIYEVSNK
jgi:predicted  nucleic acid-binding Zn-ribbon protein